MRNHARRCAALRCAARVKRAELSSREFSGLSLKITSDERVRVGASAIVGVLDVAVRRTRATCHRRRGYRKSIRVNLGGLAKASGIASPGARRESGNGERKSVTKAQHRAILGRLRATCFFERLCKYFRRRNWIARVCARAKERMNGRNRFAHEQDGIDSAAELVALQRDPSITRL